MSRLEEIIAVKRTEVEKLLLHGDALRAQAAEAREYRGFRAALQRPDDQLAVIAEIKRASPSAGVINADVNLVEKAGDYQHQGAEAISVLTDQTFFNGSLNDLIAVRDAVTVPVLRKDFIIDEIQIVESAAAGADAILLIVAALTPDQLLRYHEIASDQYNLDVLVEIHSPDEIDFALAVGAKIIGINNRNLDTFEVDLSVTESLSEMVPNDVVLVSESGFKAAEDVVRPHKCGVNAILVGEALMRGEVTIDQLRAV